MAQGREAEIIEIWKAVINVQVHFNDIAMRIRGMFVTIVLALFASLGFLLDKKIGLQAGSVVIQFAVIVPIFGVLGAYLFYFMDRYWYHRLLIGAVKQGLAIETLVIQTIPELNLTKAIGDESPYAPRGLAKFFAGLVVSHPKLKATGMLHSDGKLEFFYKSVMIALALTSVLIAFMGGVEFKDASSDSLKEKSAAVQTRSEALPADSPLGIEKRLGAEHIPVPEVDKASAQQYPKSADDIRHDEVKDKNISEEQTENLVGSKPEVVDKTGRLAPHTEHR